MPLKAIFRINFDHIEYLGKFASLKISRKQPYLESKSIS